MLILITFSSAKKLNAQPCTYSYGGGCTSTIPSTISTIFPIGTGNHCVSSDVTVQSGGVLSFTSSNIPVTGNFTITVEDGGTLVLTNSFMFGVTSMWTGIVAELGSTVTLNGSGIFFADIAVNISGTASDVSSLNVTGSCLKNNDVGIILNASSPGHISHIIEDTEFTAPALTTPKAGQVGDYGILLLGSDVIDPGPYFEIGNAEVYSSSSTFNKFNNLAIAIRAFEANLSVQNCEITDMLSTDDTDMPDGTGIPAVNELPAYDEGNVAILSTSLGLSPNFERNLLVGTSVLAASTFNNYIESGTVPGFFGIVAETKVNTEIYSNDIYGGFSGSFYYMKDGIRVRYPDSEHFIENNVIKNFRQHGILLYDIESGDATVNENTIECTEPEDDLGEYAIRAVVCPNAMEFTANNIRNVITGIFVNGSDNMNISGNEIDFVNPDPSTTTAYGVAVLNGDDASIALNTITGNCTSGGCNLNTRGIYVKVAPEFYADKNIIYDCGLAIYCEDDVNLGNMTCNEMHDSYFDVLFVNIGDSDPVGPIQSTTAEPSDNGFYPVSTNNKIRTHKTGLGVCDLSLSYWYFDDDATWSDIDDPADIYQGPGTTMINLNEEDGFYCDQPLRLSGEDGGDLALIEDYYGAWAEKYLSEDITEHLTLYNKAWTYWEDLKDDIELQEMLTGYLAVAFEAVSESNVPVLYQIKNMTGADK